VNPVASLLGNNVNQLLLNGVNSAFVRFVMNAITHNNMLRPTSRWWLAAVVGVILLVVSLSISLPALSAASRERSRLGCKAIEGNRDMYGIGIRIATYLQVVMTIFGEVYANPKYASALTSVNLWFLWALIIAMYFCTDIAQWRDIDMLRALGDTMSYMNLGALLLPTESLDLESVFTRMMRWGTLLHWQFTPTEGIRRVPDSNTRECYYDWFFFISNIAEPGKYPRAVFNQIFTYGTIGLFFLALLRVVIYVAVFPWSRTHLALKSTQEPNKHTWLEVCGDILFIYPVGDIMVLLDVVSNHPDLFYF